MTQTIYNSMPGMNILTFDIEDWYNCDFITPNLNWDKYEVRIYEGVERILSILEKRNLRATFFCLGWTAEKHPNVIRRIHAQGHHVGCHSYQHELSFRFDRKGFRQDTEKSKKLIEDLLGCSINAYRAPGFSITARNSWAFEILSELGFDFDCSIFPSSHDYGGFPELGDAEPVILRLSNGASLKEFPISMKNILGYKVIYSGGGYFRFFPYGVIKHWATQSHYLMTYFHPRDFDPDQPRIDSLPLMRKFKSYIGLSGAFHKFQTLLQDFNFICVERANDLIDWNKSRVFKLSNFKDL